LIAVKPSQWKNHEKHEFNLHFSDGCVVFRFFRIRWLLQSIYFSSLGFTPEIPQAIPLCDAMVADRIIDRFSFLRLRSQSAQLQGRSLWDV